MAKRKAEKSDSLFDVYRQDTSTGTLRMFRVGAALTKERAQEYCDEMAREPGALSIVPHHNPKSETEE